MREKISRHALNDCIDFFQKPKCYLGFEIDSNYIRSENTFGTSWGADRGYGFVSKTDTIAISLSFEKMHHAEPLMVEENLDNEKKSLGQKLYLDCYCSIQDYAPMDFFFKGKYASCTGGYTEMLTYSGYYFDIGTKYMVGIKVYSMGPIITKEREMHFKHIIETMKVDLEPR